MGKHRKTMGKPWENHRKTMGKTWENGDFSSKILMNIGGWMLKVRMRLFQYIDGNTTMKYWVVNYRHVIDYGLSSYFSGTTYRIPC
jgi:hypothetical protein